MLGDQNTAIHYALWIKSSKLFDTIIELPTFNPNVQNASGATPLIFALDLSGEKHPEQFIMHAITSLLAHPTVNLNLANAKGWTALEIATVAGAQYVRLLLDHGAAIRKSVAQTMKRWAPGVAEILNVESIKNKVNLEAPKDPCAIPVQKQETKPEEKKLNDEFARTVKADSVQEVLRLVREGADINQRLQGLSYTAAHYALFIRSKELFEDIISEPSFNPNAKNALGAPPLDIRS